MSSHSSPRIQTYKADAAILKGQVVKIGSDSKHVAKVTGNTDLAVGIAQNTVTAAEQLVEVALQGGGAKALAGESITAGKLLTGATDGDVEQTNASGDRVIAVAMEDAAAGDLFAVEVVIATADGADA